MVLSNHFSRLLSPKSRPLFKANPVVIRDSVFKSRLTEHFSVWSQAREKLGFMVWWEDLVKPGIRKLLIERGKEINKAKRGKLNLLLVRQAYLVGKLHSGYMDKLAEHRLVQLQINEWYKQESEKLILQSKIEDVLESERVRIYHHDLHAKHL